MNSYFESIPFLHHETFFSPQMRAYEEISQLFANMLWQVKNVFEKLLLTVPTAYV
jgi:hypothetical protein